MAHVLTDQPTGAAAGARNPLIANWVICVAGQGEFHVQDAQVVHHRAMDGHYSAITVGADVVMTSLMAADGRLLFQAPMASVAYIRRDPAD